ncbi:MAG: glycerophosphodiester phosphodiesterase family protein [bacterium]|nr:glycerophosphodiester phosphodiesterase family protein [bacterium]
MIYVVGHRGAAGVVPENTIKSFQYAIDLGVDYTECDVHLTRDNHLIVMHDETVDRTTNHTGRIRDLDFDTIRGLDAGDGLQVPTFDEVLKTVKGNVGLLCELKGAGVEDAAVDTVLKHDMAEEVLFTSFHMDRIERVRKRNADLRIGAILSNPTEDDIKHALGLGVQGIGIRYNNLCLRMVDQVLEAGLDLRAWNPDTLREQKAMIGLGVTGVSTNRPDILMGYLKKETQKETN